MRTLGHSNENLSIITSNGNTLVKLARSLGQRKARQESGSFLVEGIHIVGEAAEAGWEIEAVLYCDDLLESNYGKDLLGDLERKGIKVAHLSSGVFKNVAGKENPQGIMAVVKRKEWDLGGVEIENFQWGVALLSPQDAGNLGSILRSLDCAGGDALFLADGGVDVTHPTSVRASMGAMFWKPTVEITFQELVEWARQRKVSLVGSSARAKEDYRALKKIQKPLILVLGNEQKGMSAEQMGACDHVVSMPMRGRASSLNLSVAAGILMYSLLD